MTQSDHGVNVSTHVAYLLAAISSFVGAALLWNVQPMMARSLLPEFGGSAAVWTCALVFYQSALVLGYGYAHWIVRWGTAGLYIHGALLLLASFVFPVSPDFVLGGSTPSVPAIGIIWSLLLTIGGPYILLSATAPLVQGISPGTETRSPYRLFAWSNMGSILGLLGYPFIVEPFIGLAAQNSLWFGGYLGFSFVLALTLFVHRKQIRPDEFESVEFARRRAWFGLSALGVAFLMSVSDAISADLTVTPLLWVLPLFFYLLSFVICFGAPSYASANFWRPATWIASILTVYLLFTGWRVHWAVQLSLWCAVLFTGCMLCHGELVRRRPANSQLTRYYLDISIGGALAGAFIAVVMPLLLPLRIEIHLTISLAVFVAWNGWSIARKKDHPFEAQGLARGLFILAFFALLIACGAHLWKTVRGETELYRNFYGTLQVKRYPIPRKKGGLVHLLDGRISHGYQYGASPFRDEPTAYFVPQSGVGLTLGILSSPRRVIVMGLGVGTLSTYSRPGDVFDFFEINPDVIDAAKTHFSYLERSKGTARVHLGDGRILMENWTGPPADMIAIDAFSGDAIPAHLITREAIALYWSKISKDGVLAVNVSNRHAHLWRVISSHAEALGMHLARVRHTTRSPLGPYTSDWVLMVRRGDRLKDFGLKPWLPPKAGGVIWTDDYSPLYPILKPF